MISRHAVLFGLANRLIPETAALAGRPIRLSSFLLLLLLLITRCLLPLVGVGLRIPLIRELPAYDGDMGRYPPPPRVGKQVSGDDGGSGEATFLV